MVLIFYKYIYILKGFFDMSIIPSNSKAFYIVLNQHRHLSNTAVKDTSWYKVVLILRIIDIVGHSGLPPLRFEVTSNRKVQIPLYYLKILIFEPMLRNF